MIADERGDQLGPTRPSPNFHNQKIMALGAACSENSRTGPNGPRIGRRMGRVHDVDKSAPTLDMSPKDGTKNPESQCQRNARHCPHGLLGTDRQHERGAKRNRGRPVRMHRPLHIYHEMDPHRILNQNVCLAWCAWRDLCCVLCEVRCLCVVNELCKCSTQNRRGMG